MHLPALGECVHGVRSFQRTQEPLRTVQWLKCIELSAWQISALMDSIGLRQRTAQIVRPVSP
jgi:hypothetical protein